MSDSVHDFFAAIDLYAAEVLGKMPRAVFLGAAAAVKDSIQVGSPITGSPGQPVGESVITVGNGKPHKQRPGYVGGTLRKSWQVSFPSEDVAIVSTNVAYAESNEDGINRAHPGAPYTLRSAVGGRWSVRETADHFDALVDDVIKQLAPGAEQ